MRTDEFALAIRKALGKNNNPTKPLVTLIAQVSNSHEKLLDVAGEADTLTQAISELLRDFADDNWAADLRAQAESLGLNARAAIAKAEKEGEA